MNIKKILTFITSLVMCFLLCSCDNAFTNYSDYFEDLEKADFVSNYYASNILPECNYNKVDYNEFEKLDYEVTLIEDKFYIEGKFVCEYPYIVNMNEHNTFVTEDYIYSFSIQDLRTGIYHLYVFDTYFNTKARFFLEYQYESLNIVYLFDGIYMIAGDNNSRTVIRKIDVKNKVLAYEIKVADRNCLPEKCNSVNKYFNVINYSDKSYLTIANNLYEFKNYSINCCSEYPIISNLNITEQSWFYYTVSLNSIIKVSSEGETILYSWNLKRGISTRLSFYDSYNKADKYIIIPIYGSVKFSISIRHRLIGVMFFDIKNEKALYHNIEIDNPEILFVSNKEILLYTEEDNILKARYSGYTIRVE